MIKIGKDALDDLTLSLLVLKLSKDLLDDIESVVNSNGTVAVEVRLNLRLELRPVVGEIILAMKG